MIATPTSCTAHRDAPGQVVAELTMLGRRAATHLIRTSSGELVVRKHFHPGWEANFRREVAALRSLKGIDPYDVIPPLLEVGDNYFIIPYYATILPRDGLLYRCGFRLMPLHVVRRVFLALRHFYAHGYELLDMAPHHVLLDDTGKVTLIDLEFTHPGAADPQVPFRESQTIRGPLPGCPYDVPAGTTFRRRYYDTRWVLFTGLPLESVLHDPTWLQRVKRALFVPWFLSRAVWRRIPTRLRAAARAPRT